MISNQPTSQTSAETSHLQIAQFNELRELLEEDFVDLIHMYMKDSELRVQEMQNALTEQNNRLGYEAAHTLKGASSNLGATNLTELCYQLQEACRDNQIQHQQVLIEAITTENQAVNAEIMTLISQ